ncbi:secretin and TonB N-terminal domain-containing protein [Croceicoccus naphthovorans]|uniref:secretin and TonB N-terminal domain-containing protein n=1 Tax=Croceicoccus naphthovorans TaxID=1348774 RepID=UPI0014701A2D|nr:secretin and TonB N-terminal domain-containing protein [Croceicoccus naphthovorans]MBB3989514.1 hypothetical protein [Croceicoccus naphthovorans]
MRRYGLPVLVAAVSSIALLAAATPLAAQSTTAMEEHRYDIPAQPVAQAIAEFATVSGVSIIYRQSLAGDRQSTPLSGVYAAPAALRRLLEGTGLSARFTGPSSAIIFIEGQPPPTDRSKSGAAAGLGQLHLDMAEVRAPRRVGRPDPSAFNHYARRVQAEIFDRLKRDGAYEGRSFRIEIAVTVDPTGRISEVGLLRASAEPEWDARVRGVLTGMRLSSPPPEGFTRSMRFEVETDRLAKGAAVQGRRRRR